MVLIASVPGHCLSFQFLVIAYLLRFLIDCLAEMLILQYLSLAFIASSFRVTEDNFLVWSTLFLSEVFTALLNPGPWSPQLP